MRNMARSICLINLYQITMRKNFDFLFLTTLITSRDKLMFYDFFGDFNCHESAFVAFHLSFHFHYLCSTYVLLVFTCVPLVFICVHLCSFVFICVLLVLICVHSCSTCVYLCSNCVHLCSTCVLFVFICVHLCSFVFICVHFCSFVIDQLSLLTILERITFTCTSQNILCT